MDREDARDVLFTLNRLVVAIDREPVIGDADTGELFRRIEVAGIPDDPERIVRFIRDYHGPAGLFLHAVRPVWAAGFRCYFFFYRLYRPVRG
jgi:hypothetical protein